MSRISDLYIVSLYLTVALALGSDPCSLIRNPSCDCKLRNETKMSIICVTSGLSEIPTGLPDTITSLNITGSTIPAISTIPYTHLQYLHLSSNSIGEVRSNAFVSLNELKKLDLSHNKITYFDADTFAGLKSLLTLNLDGNKRYSVTRTIFTLQSIPVVRELFLSYCQITRVGDGAFSELDQLIFLNMSHNHIISLPLFNGPKNLQVLDLSYNSISVSHSGLLQSLTSLQHIYLQHNRLPSISNKMFRYLPKLTKVELHHNFITSVADDFILSAGCPIQIDLSYNFMSELAPRFTKEGCVSKLKIHDNKWQCDCPIRWMLNNKLITEWNSPDDMTCYLPAELYGKSIYGVNPHTFDCEEDIHGIRNSNVALGIGLACAIGVTIIGAVLLYHLVVRRKIIRNPVTQGDRITASYSKVNDSQEFIIPMDTV